MSIEECLQKAAGAIGWHDRRPGSGRGKGLACSWWLTTGGSSGVYVKINPDAAPPGPDENFQPGDLSMGRAAQEFLMSDEGEDEPV